MAIEILTGLLVVITGYYAWQNRNMVLEMREARAAQLVPKLVPTLGLLGGGNCLAQLVNVGHGPALNVDIEIGFGPNGPTRRWVNPVVPSGTEHDFLLREEGINLLVADQLVDRYSELRLRGSYQDALGSSFTVDETVDIREMWQLTKSANLRQPVDDPATKALRGLRSEVQDIARAVKK